jgi:hypothetical protein
MDRSDSSRLARIPLGWNHPSDKNTRRFNELEHFQAKWKPVRVKKMRQNKNLEPRSDKIGTEKALSAVLLLAFTGFASEARAEAVCAAPAEMMARVELFFGSGSATPGAFAHFLAHEVTPRFPDGLSLFEGYGQWRDGARHISREHSRLILIYYHRNADADARIEAIRAAYKQHFHQQSVLRADSSACVAF